MIDLTQANHFRFGYNGDAFNTRQTPEDQWTVTYGQISRPIGDFRVEAAEAAKRVRESTDLPLWVMFSGGCDSEVVIRAFIDAKIPIKVAICEFNEHLNVHDTSYAVVACESLKVPYQFIPLDIIDFFRSGRGHEYAAAVQCVSPAMAVLMWIMDQIDGYPIIGSGECYLVKKKPDDYVQFVSLYGNEPWVMLEKERIAGLYRYLISHNREGCAGFFQYTPEVMLSFLQAPEIAQICANQSPFRTTTLYVKNDVYYRSYPGMIRRRKFTGYEKIKEVSQRFEMDLTEEYADYNGIIEHDYNNLVTHLLGSYNDTETKDVH